MAAKAYSKLDQIGQPSVRHKKVKAWENARRKLKQDYARRGITRCEVCGASSGLSFAHRHKRRDTDSEELGSFHDTILLCIPCHQTIESSKERTTQLFARLRP